jgi:hypothetical protein
MNGLGTGRRRGWRQGLMVATMAVATLIGASLAASGPVRAAGPDPDVAALRGYSLSFDKAQHYAAASKALKKDADTKPDIANEIQSMQGEPQASLADITAMMTRHPKIYGYFQREGLSLHDTVMLPLALVSAMSAVESPAPERFAQDVSPDQLAFARQHMQELKLLFGQGPDSGR